MLKRKLGIAILLSFILFGGVARFNPSYAEEPTKQPSLFGQIWSIISDPEVQTIQYNELRPDVRKQVDCLADNIYFEARSEPEKGQVAVAQVTMNRVRSGRFAETVCGVVRQKTNDVCQFSWWCDTKARAQSLKRSFFDWDTYEKIREIAIAVYFNHDEIPDVTNGALFFHAARVAGTRSPGLQKTVHIGQHVFYRTRP